MNELKKLVTDVEGSQITGIGRNNFRAIAEKAGAVIRIGRKRLTQIEKVMKYIEEHPNL